MEYFEPTSKPWLEVIQVIKHFMYKNRTAYIIAILSIFVITASIASLVGKKNRIYLPDSKIVTVDSPEKACTLWQQNGVHGRILLLFDTYPHMKGLRFYDASPQLTRWNFVEYSIFKNIIRRIYLIVPEESWQDFKLRSEIRPLSDPSSPKQSIRLTTNSGIQMTAVTPASIPRLKETVLVYINTQEFDARLATELLSAKEIHSDLILQYRSISR